MVSRGVALVCGRAGSSTLTCDAKRLTDHKLNCEQTKAVLATFFGLGDVRVNAVKAIYPRLADPQNFKSTVLVEAFKYDDERSQVVQALGL